MTAIFHVDTPETYGAPKPKKPSKAVAGLTKKHNAKRKVSPKKIHLSEEDMKRYFTCSQVLAARLLQVSLSTLKRRYV